MKYHCRDLTQGQTPLGNFTAASNADARSHASDEHPSEVDFVGLFTGYWGEDDAQFLGVVNPAPVFATA